MAAHRYWRLNITMAASGSGVSGITIAECIMAVTIGGSQVATSGTASANSTNGSNVASRAFDGNVSTNWASLAINTIGSAQLQYDFGSGVARDLAEVRITGPASSLTTAPRDFTIEYSDNGSSWTVAHTVTGQTSWTANQTRAFAIPGGGEVAAPSTSGRRRSTIIH